jgi:hypothetical protein
MSHSDNEYSGGAVGLTVFAAILMMLGGGWSIIVGLAGIANDAVWGVVPAIGTEEQGDAYVFALDTTTWGWIHLLLGLLVLFAGLALLRGATWARVVGVILAVLSAIANFLWLPWYPIWAISVIVLDVFIIWALTAHGRDISKA